MLFRKKSTRQAANGFPETGVVKVKKFKDGSLILLNGSNAFNIPAINLFTEITVRDGESATGVIVGRKSDGTDQVLARFGSSAIAQGGHAALIKAHSGLSEGGTGWAMKAGVTVAALLLINAVLGAGMQASATPGAAVQMNVQPLLAPAAQDAASAQVISPQQTLDQLANGGYTFQAPALKMPNVQAPALNCAPTN